MMPGWCYCDCHGEKMKLTDAVAMLSACSKCYGAHVLAIIEPRPLELPDKDAPIDLGEGSEE